MTEKEKAQAPLDKNKAAKEGKTGDAPQSVDDFVNAGTSNIDMAALEKQAQADRANAAYETETKEIGSLSKLTPAIISGLSREQAVDVLKRYGKNLTEEQKKAISEKIKINRYQHMQRGQAPAQIQRKN